MTQLYENVITPQIAANLIDTAKSSNDEWQKLLIGVKKDNLNKTFLSSNPIDWDAGSFLHNAYFKELRAEEPSCEKLHGHLQQYLAPIVKIKPSLAISYSFYKWGPGGELQMHNDDNYSFSATLFLNDNWHMDWGGFLIWLTNDNKEQVVKPTFGRLVIFENEERHLVTPISKVAETERLSIQIRGIKLESFL